MKGGWRMKGYANRRDARFSIIRLLGVFNNLIYKKYIAVKKSVQFSLLLFFTLFILIISIIGDPLSATIVSINPASQIVGPNIFSLSVYCNPTQPIKAYELKLSFNSSLIQALSVTEGDIFEGFSTFFNAGIINNSAGTIINVYGLILGAGNVSNPGTLVNISFSGESSSGISALNLYDVGVTNETSYLPISVVNGTVQVDANPPVFSNVTASPSSQEISGFVNISAEVVDNIAIDTVFVNITYPDSISENISITGNKTGDVYYYNSSYEMMGWYSYFIWSNDTVGNSDVSAVQMFNIGDMTSPVISDFNITTSEPLDTDPAFGWVNVSCNVSDNVAVSDVLINIKNPDGSWNNISLELAGGINYYLNSSDGFSEVGNYTYHISANDTSDNTAISGYYNFSMAPNWDINKNGVINILDIVTVSNLFGELGVAGWIREDVDNNGEIQVFDLVIISNHYGETWWEA
jgi:hypothetical protein